MAGEQRLEGCPLPEPPAPGTRASLGPNACLCAPAAGQGGEVLPNCSRPEQDVFPASCVGTVSKHVRKCPRGNSSPGQAWVVAAEQPGAHFPGEVALPWNPWGRGSSSGRARWVMSLGLTLGNRTGRGVSPGKGLSTHLEQELASRSQEWALVQGWCLAGWQGSPGGSW